MTEPYAYINGTRYRATADAATYEAWPAAGRDLDLPNVIHWVELHQDEDAFLAGIYGGLSWVTDRLFGDFLGPLFEAAILSNREVWEGQEWRAVVA